MFDEFVPLGCKAPSPTRHACRAEKGANAAAGSLGWLTNHKVEGAMQSTPHVAGTETMILSPDEAEPVIARHRARFSGNVRIAAHSEWDITARHAEAFGAITDITTLA